MRCSSCLISLPNRGALHRAWDLESFLDGKPPRIPKGPAMIAKQLNFLAPGFDAASGLAVESILK